MSIWPFKKSYPSSVSDIQIELFNAIKSRNMKLVESLINTYDEVIRHEFPRWKVITEDVRRNSKWEEWYMNGLIGLADVYKQCGISSLIDQLVGNQENNPIVKWQKIMVESQKALDDNKPGVVLTLLEPIIKEMLQVSGTAVDEFLPICHGMVGAAYFKMGDIEDAITETTKALEKCKINKDKNGIQTYTNNLKMISGA
jgi:hypothetical protein